MLFDKILRISTTFRNSTSSETETLAQNNKISALFNGRKENKLMTTKLHAHNTRLCSQAGYCALSGFCARISLVVARQEIRPQTARAHSLGRYGQVQKK